MPSSGNAPRRGQWSLIGALVAAAILIAVAAIYLPRLVKPQSSSGADQTAIQRADGAQCAVYLSQLNAAVEMYKQDHEGQPPRRLADLKKYQVTDEMLHAPGCSFQMDPATGAVTSGPPAPAAGGQ